MDFKAFVSSLRLPADAAAKVEAEFAGRWAAMDARLPPDDYAERFLAPETVRRNWGMATGLPPSSLDEILDVAARVRADTRLTAIAALLHWTLFEDADGPGTWLMPYPGDDLADETEQGPFNLLVALGFAPTFTRSNRERGIPDETISETLRQISCYDYNFRRAHGKAGIFRSQLAWLHCYVPPRSYFRLGRLEFQLKPNGQEAVVFRNRRDGSIAVAAPPGFAFTADGRLCHVNRPIPADALRTVFEESPESARCSLVRPDGGIDAEPAVLDKREWECVLRRGDPVLETHIPSGGGLRPELVEDSFARSFAFFDRHFPGHGAKALVCSSWILSPQLGECLPPDSNILAFQRKFRRLPVAPHDGSEGSLWFLFLKRPPYDPAALPRDTSMRRAVAEWLERGEAFCGGAGFRLRGEA
jgi:hypothetical protein